MDHQHWIVLLFLLFLHLIPTSTSPTSPHNLRLLDQIVQGTDLIRQSHLHEGKSILIKLLSTIEQNSSLLPLIQNNYAASLLLSTTDTHQPLELLKASAATSVWCSAPIKNLRWALAAVPEMQRAKHFDHWNADLEIHSWRHAVYQFAQHTTNNIDKQMYIDMKSDNLTRFLDWCIDKDNAICQSPLGAAITLQLDNRDPELSGYDDDDRAIISNAMDINKQCRHHHLWINLFDDAAILAHQQLCHPTGAMFTNSKYLDLLYRTITGYLYQETKHVVPDPKGKRTRPRAFTWSLSYGSVFGESTWLASSKSDSALEPMKSSSIHKVGDHMALTGVQVGSLVMLDSFVQDIHKNQIDGDVVEAGVWRGGSSIAMAASLEVRSDSSSSSNSGGKSGSVGGGGNENIGGNRKVWLFDTFKGVPKTTDSAPDMDEVKFWTPNRYAASLESVRKKFERFGLDQRAVFVEGNFLQTMVQANGSVLALPEKIALLRIDVDSYEGTKIVLEQLYSRVSDNGIIIVDDYHLRGCRMAIHEFRQNLPASTVKPLFFTPIDFVNTCDLDAEKSAAGLKESLRGGDVDVSFRSGPQVVYWRK